MTNLLGPSTNVHGWENDWKCFIVHCSRVSTLMFPRFAMYSRASSWVLMVLGSVLPECFARCLAKRFVMGEGQLGWL
jgi:hypothetical protein